MSTAPSDTSEEAPVWIGLDVSKVKLDACFVDQSGVTRSKSFANTPAGWAPLLAWALGLAQQKPCHFALEATACYSDGVALFLCEQNQKVSVLNPRRVHFAALAAGAGNKTDQADARLIAEFCRKENPPVWQPPSPELRTLADLVRRREDLLEALGQEKNRQEQQSLTAFVKQSLQRNVRSLEREVARVEKAIAQHVAGHPTLAQQAALLESIPGISHLTAQKILAELGGAAERFASSSSAAAYAGLAPREHRSGSSVRKKARLSKRGNAALRKALYFPTVTALRWNPLVKAFYERLVASGKRKMVALGAAMRKLLLIAVGVLRSGKPFDPTWSEKVRQGRSESALAAT
jgi:transposase